MELPAHFGSAFVPRRGCAGHGNGRPGRRRPVWLHPLSPDRKPRLKGIDGRGHLYTQQRGGSGSFLHRLMLLCCPQRKIIVGWTERSSQAGAQRHRRNTFLCRVDLTPLTSARHRRPPSPAAIPGIRRRPLKAFCEELVGPMTDFSPHRSHAGAIERFGIPAVLCE